MIPGNSADLRTDEATDRRGHLPFKVAPGYECAQDFFIIQIYGNMLMQVDEATVRRIARLARIKISQSEAKALKSELSRILEWVEQLDEVDVSGVEPMTAAVEMTLRQREDKVTDGERADAVIANAPMADDHFFVVPKVVE